MKKYNRIIIVSFIIYIIIAFLSGNAILNLKNKNLHAYRIESNQIINQITSPQQIINFNYDNYDYVQEIKFLDKNISEQLIIKTFFLEDNKNNSQILPFYQDDQLLGYIKIMYQLPTDTKSILIILEGSLLILEIFILYLLWNMKRKLIKPFQHLNELPLQLAKGHFKGIVKEEKNKYLGQFMWGISQLKDTLDTSQKRQLALLKERKEMLLLLSHDMKTPLNIIKLYNKALKENIYTNQEAKQYAMRQIEIKIKEIEKYIDEIIKSSREDILDLEVKNEEFYLKDLMNRVLLVYREQCNLRQIKLMVYNYENKLLKGDIDRCQEVFDNIFENAFKYGDGREIIITFSEEDYCQLIQVYNTGKSVADTDFNHLFESFFRGANSHNQKGTGLGLYICREIMKKMDGAIYAKKDNNGMAFTIVIRQ